MTEKRRVLFLCTGNACRSPMAEGILRKLGEDRYESLSAGSHPAGFVHALSVAALRELGIDISKHRSRSFKEFLPPRGPAPDVLVSLCDFAQVVSAAFPPETVRLHWPIFDPILAEGNEAEQLAVFREVRDEIHERISQAIRSGELG